MHKAVLFSVGSRHIITCNHHCVSSPGGFTFSSFSKPGGEIFSKDGNLSFYFCISGMQHTHVSEVDWDFFFGKILKFKKRFNFFQ